MKNSSVHNLSQRYIDGRGGFTLIEVVTALAVLAFISTATLTVVKQVMAAAADTSMRIQALDVARENMEKKLSATKVKEGSEFGDSEKYPNITWETTVESFPEPISQRMWVRVVSTANYTDTNDVDKKVELTHWITSVTKDQLLQLANEQQTKTNGAGLAGNQSGSDNGTDQDNSEDQSNQKNTTETKLPDWWDKLFPGKDPSTVSITDIIQALKESGQM